ncbi:hypothetical protein SEA_BENCZKOWSKI14_69 [Gordonia phage Benczkowski14]|uniref:Uncharacterized protein n=5 Tax=Demosthenesvirus katyusha TaxID=1982108 RepID=A0A345MCA6_9CAUD|nr:hypothetical protein BH765_gp68 [Gordonia phage Kvothe]YP_009603343.1 hypothetical protein FDH67_gp69 [Gordonia phage Katyusha]AMS03779.1 hypothetical protein SEA_BENCZKOWSKI14_69 [Gordonia phage Benczkowski14]AXH68127.1 hypothetical protein SEA_TEATEALATTE_70 [Gordonia phage Teatealatte]QBP29625.1 hypothetical protein SEA_TREDGE_69 [Gordonia phage Tredge]UJD20704.1 hypothetical protein SEA_NIAGARA_69 [Gordonia phage Niagara]UYL87088.1 hypothetical protein SEA_HOLLOW_70 [Gordonia phage Hol
MAVNFFGDFVAECGCKGEVDARDMYDYTELDVTITEHCNEHTNHPGTEQQ